MLGMVSNYKREDHTILHGGEIAGFVKRLADKSGRDLFLMRYNKLGVFCICEWMSPNRDIFIDSMNLGKSLGNLTRAKANELRQRLFAPLTAEGTSRGIYEAESDFHHGLQDGNEEETERLAKCAIGE